MRYVNKKFSLTIGLMVLFMALGASIPVHASEADPRGIPSSASDTSSTVSYTVIGLENSEQLANLAPVEIVRRSTQNTEPLFYHVSNNGLLNVNASIKDSNGNITTQTLSVSWSCWDDSTTVTDTTVCGEYLETGIIQLPDASYQWGDGVLSALSLPVRVYDPAEPVEIVTLEEVWNEFDAAFALEQNSSIEDFLDTAPIQTAWPCYDAAGNEYLCPVVYNTEEVREDTVGIYYITATFEVPLNCRFADSLTIPSYSMPVTVQAPGQPRLDLFYLSANYEYILFPWITSGIDLDTVEIWLSENEGEWRMLQLNDEAYIHPDMLDLYAWYLNEGSSYRIQVKYEGGQTGIASFTYEWDMLSDKEYIEGDRDGGDTNGNPPEDYEEDDSDEEESVEVESVAAPEPVAGEEPVAATEPATEPVAGEPSAAPDNSSVPNDENVDTAGRETPYLLGSELNHMIQNMGTTRFSAETIMLNIPADAIASLGISDTDRFLVTILPLENDGFSIDIFKNDSAVTIVSSMQVSLPYRLAGNTTPVLVNVEGSVITEGVYNQGTGLVTFSINETGTFYIQTKEISATAKDNERSVFTPLAIVAAVIICSAAATIFIYAKKRKA